MEQYYKVVSRIYIYAWNEIRAIEFVRDRDLRAYTILDATNLILDLRLNGDGDHWLWPVY